MTDVGWASVLTHCLSVYIQSEIIIERDSLSSQISLHFYFAIFLTQAMNTFSRDYHLLSG